MHVTLGFAQDSGETVYSFGARTLPEFQGRGIFSQYITSAGKILYQHYLPNLKRIRGFANLTHPASGKGLVQMGLNSVCSFPVGLYEYTGKRSLREVIDGMRLGSSTRRLFTPTDGNLTRTTSSNQLDIVDSSLIPSGVLFVDTFVYSATIPNLTMLMKQGSFHGSFSEDGLLTALSYGGVSHRTNDYPTWWSTISAVSPESIEDLVKVISVSALRCAESGVSGSPVHLVCYFNDLSAKTTADAVLNEVGFDVCHTLPGHPNFSNIVIFEI